MQLPRLISALSALVLVMMPAAAQAQAKAVPGSAMEMKLSFAPVVRQVAPAVVNIYTKQRVTVMEKSSPFMSDPFFNQFFGGGNTRGFTFGGRPREQVVSSLGSGVIIRPEGLVVTSHHVIRDAQEITVVLSDKREFPASVVLKDATADLAFLKIKVDETLPFLDMHDSDALEVGDLVLAVGNPFGVGQTVTNGIISALARKAEGVSDYQFFIQTDAAINPGNSGGALVDMSGRLIGINTAIYSRTGGSQGIGFAIPVNMVRSLVEGIKEGGKVVRPWIGISVQPVTAEIAEAVGMKIPRGVIVQSLYPNSAADKGGIRVGDVLFSFNGFEIGSSQDLQYRLALAKIGQSGKFELLRNGKALTVEAELIAPPEDPKRDIRTIKGRNPLGGLVVANLSPAVATELGINDMTAGVIVVGIKENELGINVGIQRGDLILEINGEKVTSTEKLANLMSDKNRTWKIAYQRGNNVLTLTVRM
jgi:Do/DeqQ family serine protease